MNWIKRRKMERPGTIIVVEGTCCAFISLGLKGDAINTCNGFDLDNGLPVIKCSGKGRLATKEEQAKYWDMFKAYMEKGER